MWGHVTWEVFLKVMDGTTRYMYKVVVLWGFSSLPICNPLYVFFNWPIHYLSTTSSCIHLCELRNQQELLQFQTKKAPKNIKKNMVTVHNKSWTIEKTYAISSSRCLVWGQSGFLSLLHIAFTLLETSIGPLNGLFIGIGSSPMTRDDALRGTTRNERGIATMPQQLSGKKRTGTARWSVRGH